MVARPVKSRKSFLVAIEQRLQRHDVGCCAFELPRKLLPQRVLVDAEHLAVAHDLLARSNDGRDVPGSRPCEEGPEGIIQAWRNIGRKFLVVEHDEVGRRSLGELPEVTLAAYGAGAGSAAGVENVFPRDLRVEAEARVQQI